MIVRNLCHFVLMFFVEPKNMEMIVEPSHGILDGYVQVPETVSARNLYPPPYRRLNPAKRDLELIDQVALLSFHRFPSLHNVFLWS